MMKSYSPRSTVNESVLDAPVRTVSGITAQAIGNNQGTLPSHEHAFEFRVMADDDGEVVAGETETMEGHSHTITNSSKTEPAADGHYHALPAESNKGPFNEPNAKAEGFDVLSFLNGDDKMLGEWVTKALESTPAKK